MCRKPAGGRSSEEARRLFRRALEANSGDTRAAIGLARLLLSQRNLRNAAGTLWAATERAPFDLRVSPLQREIALTLYHERLWEDAEPWLERAVALAPWDRPLAAAYARARRPDYLASEIHDPLSGKSLRRYAAREGDTYIFVIDVVGTCNLRCPTCPVGNSPERPRGFMELALFEKIIAKIRRKSPVPTPIINLYNWGEPLLHPDLPAIITILHQAGMRSQLSTNLNVKRGLEAVIAADADALKISLSGFHRKPIPVRTHAATSTS